MNGDYEDRDASSSAAVVDRHCSPCNSQLSAPPPAPYAQAVWCEGRDRWSRHRHRTLRLSGQWLQPNADGSQRHAMATLVQPTTHVIAVVLALSASLWLSACASSVESPRSTNLDSPVLTIFVSLDTWHAMIAFPIQQGDSDQPSAFSSEEGTFPQHSSLRTQHLYEEWGYEIGRAHV